ncbi:Chaperone protein DnaJ [Clavibacter michiganensis subsp. michiganensis]|uniref:Chaperone protein DnaJ n=1 Tax=Clavibacter michiganensis subsp. michiganensis TaxID=33013 RepID=A0A251XH95_CLAMM|nr:Chaperone protein DnaJ [Clavibacter michiganensis subsp. michiganensis]OUE02537.1 Chaperone protein DnaJ [Clavibacter michiganensis subsp. michiganensis]
MSRAGSPADRTPYEVLGVDPAADTATIRAAYRRLVRATHPDTGGQAHLFHAVQRAWELVGDPDDRAAYDRGQGRTTTADDDPLGPDDAGYAPVPGSGTRLGAAVHGAAGAFARAHYLDRVAEWQGVAPGTELGVDPWSPELVRRARATSVGSSRRPWPRRRPRGRPPRSAWAPRSSTTSVRSTARARSTTSCSPPPASSR